MSQEKFDKTFSLLKGALTYDEFKTVDLVIEVINADKSLLGAFLSNGSPHFTKQYIPRNWIPLTDHLVYDIM